LIATGGPAEITARLTPNLDDVNLADFALGGLAEPLPAPVDLTAVLKDVAFATPTVFAAGDETPLDNAPGLDLGETLANPLAAVEGMLFRVTGTIGIPVNVGHVSVSAEVCFQAVVRDDQWGDQLLVEPASEGPPAGNEWCISDPSKGVFGATTAEPTITLPVVPPLVPMRASEIGKTCNYEVTAKVRLSALGEGPVEVTVGPLIVPVPVVPVPTVLGVFSEVDYSLSKDGAKMFIVPADVPVDTQVAIDQLRTVQSVLAKVQGLGRVAAFLAGIGSVLNTVKPPIDQRHKLLFKQFDQTKDLGKTASDWRHRPWFDDHGAEDDIDSAVLISIDQKVEMFEDQNFKDTKVVLEPSSQTFHVLVPDFHDMSSFSPADANIDAGKNNFSDEAHSLRFMPR
jgi:hypothetical protein